jgi:hypothetical protein
MDILKRNYYHYQKSNIMRNVIINMDTNSFNEYERSAICKNFNDEISILLEETLSEIYIFHKLFTETYNKNLKKIPIICFVSKEIEDIFKELLPLYFSIINIINEIKFKIDIISMNIQQNSIFKNIESLNEDFKKIKKIFPNYEVDNLHKENEEELNDKYIIHNNIFFSIPLYQLYARVVFYSDKYLFKSQLINTKYFDYKKTNYFEIKPSMENIYKYYPNIFNAHLKTILDFNQEIHQLIKEIYFFDIICENILIIKCNDKYINPYLLEKIANDKIVESSKLCQSDEGTINLFTNLITEKKMNNMENINTLDNIYNFFDSSKFDVIQIYTKKALDKLLSNSNFLREFAKYCLMEIKDNEVLENHPILYKKLKICLNTFFFILFFGEIINKLIYGTLPFEKNKVLFNQIYIIDNKNLFYNEIVNFTSIDYKIFILTFPFYKLKEKDVYKLLIKNVYFENKDIESECKKKGVQYIFKNFEDERIFFYE